MAEVKYIKTLDGWRAIAIVVVIISHLKHLVPNSINSEEIQHIMGGGVKGVSLFFAISGFIIASKLFNELNESGSIKLKDFYERRFFRLYPTILTYVLFLIGLAFVGYISLTKIEVLASLFSFRNYISMDGPPSYTGVLWSLSVEEHFYLLFPFFLLLLKEKKKYFLGLIIACVLVAIWRKLGTVESFISLFPFSRYTIWNTFGRLDGMVYGVLLAFLHLNHKDFCVKYFAKIPTALVFVLLLIVFRFKIPLAPVIEAILYPLLFYTTITNPHTIFSKLLESKLFRFLGNISFSLYIWHSVFIYPMPGAPAWIQTVIGHWYSVFIAVFVAYLNYKMIENPLRKMGNVKLRSELPVLEPKF